MAVRGPGPVLQTTRSPPQSNIISLRGASGASGTGLRRREPSFGELSFPLGPDHLSPGPRTSDHRLKDAYASAILSEVIYKAVDRGHEAAETAARRLEALLPSPVGLGPLSWSPAASRTPYVMTETADTLYVAFLGTKRPFDIWSALNWKGTADFLPGLGDVHKGFVARAAAVPSEQLWRLASVKGKRLVFTGHSMGGAVAKLCALKLLTQLPPALHASVSAVGFATPPLGNAAVAAAVAERGWNARLIGIMLPEDWVPGALTLWKSKVAGQVVRRVSSAPARLDEAAEAALKEAEQATAAAKRAQRRLVRRGAAVLGWLVTGFNKMAGMMGAVALRAGGAAVRVAGAAIHPLRFVTPSYAYIGHQVYLRRSDTGQKVKTARQESPDPLVPLIVKPSPMSAHRMVSYRLRMLEAASSEALL